MRELKQKIEVFLKFLLDKTIKRADQSESESHFSWGKGRESQDKEFNRARDKENNLGAEYLRLKNENRRLITELQFLKQGSSEKATFGDLKSGEDKPLETHESQKNHETLKDLEDNNHPDKNLPQLEDNQAENKRKQVNKGVQVNPNENKGKTQNTDKEKDQTPVSHIPKDLKLQVDSLHQAYLRSSEKYIQNLTLTNQQFAVHKEPSLIGGKYTFMALKSHNSYMIGSILKGIKVIENGLVVHKSLCDKEDCIRDLIYIEKLDCYIMAYDWKLYRKDIDNKRPYLFIDVVCGIRFGASLRFSTLNNRLITNKDMKTICAINLETRAVEIQIEKKVGNEIYDFRVFGKLENRVVSITRDGYVVLHRLNYQQKDGSVSGRLKVKLLEERQERFKSVVVCSRGEYIFLEIGQAANPFLCSRMMVLKLRGENLEIRTTLDQFERGVADKLALECFGYVGSHILLVGVSKEAEGKAQVFDYDTLTEEFREVREKRILRTQSFPVKLERKGNHYYYTGSQGRIMRLTVNF